MLPMRSLWSTWKVPGQLNSAAEAPGAKASAAVTLTASASTSLFIASHHSSALSTENGLGRAESSRLPSVAPRGTYEGGRVENRLLDGEQSRRRGHVELDLGRRLRLGLRQRRRLRGTARRRRDAARGAARPSSGAGRHGLREQAA